MSSTGSEQYKSSPFAVKQGNDLDPEFTYKLNSVAQDISTGELTFVLKEDEYATTELVRLENTAAGGGDDEISWITDGTDGQFYVHLSSSLTASLDEGDYWWEIELIIGGKKTTIGQNKLTILATMIAS